LPYNTIFIHFLYYCWIVGKWYLTLLSPHGLQPASVHGIFQARILEWVAISFSRGSSQPRDWTWVSRVVGRCFTIIYTMKYYLVIIIKKDKTMLFTGTWMDLEIVTVNEVRHRKTNVIWYHLYVEPNKWGVQRNLFTKQN